MRCWFSESADDGSPVLYFVRDSVGENSRYASIEWQDKETLLMVRVDRAASDNGTCDVHEIKRVDEMMDCLVEIARFLGEKP